MPKIVFVAAMEREVALFVKDWKRTERTREGRAFTFFENVDFVCICGGIGVEAARRATQAAIALYHPPLIQSVGFAGALDSTLRVGDIFTPSMVLDARDGSRYQLSSGKGTLITFMEVASAAQKAKLNTAYAAQAVDMEAAAVAAAAGLHGIAFSAVKVISDEADFEIRGTSQFIDTAGQFRTANFVCYMALRPWLWKSVATLAANGQKAAKALAKYLQQTSSNLAAAPMPAATLNAGGRN
jgi:adenosylhomocysteine nucleosidase